MTHSHDEQLPEDLREIAGRLREERAQVSALDLDRIKMRALAAATPAHRKGTRMKSRALAAALTLALMVGGTGGVIAATSTTGPGNGNASNSQYKPGCGPPPNGVTPSGQTHTGQDGDRSQCYGNSGH